MTTRDPMIHIREVLADTLTDWQALFRIADECIVETNAPDRMRWEGVWYDGPPATAFIQMVRAVGKLAERNATMIAAALDQPSLKDDDVERVARAIYLTRRNRQRAALGYMPLSPDTTEIGLGVAWSEAVEAAKAAIEAMSVSSCGSAHD